MLNYSDQSLLATWNVELQWPIITGYMKCWTTVTNHYWLHEMLNYSDQSLPATWNVELQWPIITGYMKCWTTVTNHYRLHEMLNYSDQSLLATSAPVTIPICNVELQWPVTKGTLAGTCSQSCTPVRKPYQYHTSTCTPVYCHYTSISASKPDAAGCPWNLCWAHLLIHHTHTNLFRFTDTFTNTHPLGELSLSRHLQGN